MLPCHSPYDNSCNKHVYNIIIIIVPIITFTTEIYVIESLFYPLYRSQYTQTLLIDRIYKMDDDDVL